MKLTKIAGFAILAATALAAGSLNGQDKKEAMNSTDLISWFNKGDYLNGLNPKPHESVTKQTFWQQYAAHKERWDAAFTFLRERNLNELPVGKYEILGSDVYASVTEGPTRKPEDARWEVHHAYADIQYVISGKETMGVAPAGAMDLTGEFNTQKDVGFGNVLNGAYHTMDSTLFQIFFPTEPHRPNLAVDGSPVVKKVVIKVRCD